MAAATQQRVVGIVGAGIAGPALALQLLSHPRLAALYRPILFDQSSDPLQATPTEERKHRPSAGAAVGIFANGLYPLYNLGLREALEEASSDFSRIDIWTSDYGRADGSPGTHRWLNGCDNAAWSNELQSSTKSIERTRLQALLLGLVRQRGGEIQWDKRIQSFEPLSPGRSRIIFKDETSVTVDLLVGADGGFSAVRRHVLAQRNPETAEQRWLPDFMGQTGFYGVSSGFPLTEDEKSKTTHAVWLYPGILSSSPIPGGKIRWDLIIPEKEPPPPPRPGDDAASTVPRSGWEAAVFPSAYPHESSVEILQKYSGVFHPAAGSFGRLLENAERIIRSPLRQRVWKADEIQCGNVALIGDAARLMLPSSGQGTGFAIEDATVLANVLLKHGESSELDSAADFSSALRDYARQRVPRSEKMAFTADMAGRFSLGQPWYWRWLRDGLSAWLPAGKDYKKSPTLKDPWPFSGRFDVE